MKTKESEVNKEKRDWKTLKKVFGLIKPFKGLFWFCLFAGILVAFISTVRPYLIKILVDDNILTLNKSGILKWSIVSVVFLIFEFLFRYLFGYLSGLLGQSVIKDLRVRVFNHVK